MWKKIERYFNTYCEHSSIIGFNYVAEKRSKGERLLWLLLIAVAIALSVYFILQMWYKYDENPFIVSLATRERPIFTIPFPAVTICPAVKARRSLFNYTNVVHRLWDEEEISPYEKETAQYMTLTCDTEDINSFLPQNATFTEHFYKRLHELDSTEGFLTDSAICIFMNNHKNCTDYLVPIILDQGLCYTFNILTREEIYRPKVYHYENFQQHKLFSEWTNDNGYPKGARKDVYPRRALQAGADNYLMILLPQLIEDTDFLCSDQIGYTVTIHAPNTVPSTEKDFFIMPPDVTSTVVIRPDLMTTSETVKGYKLEDRQCYFSDERYLEFFLSYTQENCYLECLTNYTLKKCNCVNFFMPHENTTEICGNAMIDCMEEAEDELKIFELNAELEESHPDVSYQSCNCFPLCTQLSYKTESSRYQWQWREYFRAHKKWEIPTSTMNSIHFSMLQVFFKSDKFLPTEKNELYGPFDFLSNFGGLLGLFTGFSLLSAVELVYFMSVRLWCNKRLYNDVSGPQEEDEV